MEDRKGSIIVIGDSLSKGVVFSEEKQRYIFSPSGFIKELTKKLSVPVHNLAKFGSNITYGKKVLEEKMQALDPRIVLIEFGGNDCDFKWDEVAENPHANHQPQVDPDEFESQLCTLVEDLKEKNKIPVLMNLPPVNANAYFNWFTGGSKEKGEKILIWLGSIHRIFTWQEGYSKRIDKIAQKTKTHLINVRDAFMKSKDFTALICKDGIHPNESGQRLMQSVVEEYIKENADYLFA